MRIGGFLKFSLVDYPGKVAAVIFTQGCNFRCRYCHNKKLVLPECFEDPIPEKEVFDFLEKRKGVLQGVVITGGEPTLQKDLAGFLEKVKGMGYALKLDTNGSSPHVLKDVITAGLVDFIAMDIKAPLERYSAIAGVEVDTQAIGESIDIISNSGVDHLLRTTVVRSLFCDEDFGKISSLIADSPRYVLQRFSHRETVLDTTLLDKRTYSDEEFDRLQKAWGRDLCAAVLVGTAGR